tara:strand:+ start:320 stop:475 length:156 start_codon:yes stop_codon:yes gene_type:complete
MKETKKEVIWSLEIGLYPGILFGVRSYKEESQDVHVLYLPFVDLALTICKE